MDHPPRSATDILSDLDQTTHNATSHLGFHCLLAVYSLKIQMKFEIPPQNIHFSHIQMYGSIEGGSSQIFRRLAPLDKLECTLK